MKNEKNVKKMIEFINESPTPFHVIENIEKKFKKQGYIELDEKENWKVELGKNYYTKRNGSSIIAFQVPEKYEKGFRIISSHSDSPCFKVKENPEMFTEQHYTKLNIEKYGGMIPYTWLDRPLSVAGRLFFQGKEALASKVINLDKDSMMIPSVAIHLSKDMKNPSDLNPQIDLLPLFSAGEEKADFVGVVCKEGEIEKKELMGWDLYLYNRDKGKLLGADEEFIASPRLDDLECVYCSMEGLLRSENPDHISLIAVFDNEEVGSRTRQGAESTFLTDVLERIYKEIKKVNSNEIPYSAMIQNSFMVSADNAHGIHPNHPELGDPTNRPLLNKGIVMKFHGGQKYTTDGETAAIIRQVANKAGVPVQVYYNRADQAGGSTLGNISTTQVSMPSADIGLAQLAMHSAVELAGSRDVEYLIQFSKAFFEK